MEIMGNLWKIYREYGTSMEHIRNLCFFLGNYATSIRNMEIYGKSMGSMENLWKT